MPLPKRDRREYMRAYRRRASQDSRRIKIPADGRGTGNDVTCPLCFESFESGSAYMQHFKETRWGPEEVHQCLSREELRETGRLDQNWETGSWRVRR